MHLETEVVLSLIEEFERGKPIVMPIYPSAVYEFQREEDEFNILWKKETGYRYGRWSNPTVRALEKKVAQLERCEDGVSFSSGMGAITCTLLALLRAGQSILIIKEVYGDTLVFAKDFLPQYGIKVFIHSVEEKEQIEDIIDKGMVSLLYLESPTNPTLRVIDIKNLTIKAKKLGIKVVVDNTFATPINQRPRLFGADIIIHSATKYLCGHNDTMGGIVVGNKEDIAKIWDVRRIFGNILGPFDAYLVLRGIKTLALRVEKQNESAMEIARWLEKHPKVKKVYYPGLESHPDHEIAKSQMDGFGGMVSFDIDTTADGAAFFMDSLQLIKKAPSLGAVESLITRPAFTSHRNLPKEEKERLGITETLIRLSIGIENVEDLKEDIDRALKDV
ncbi:MAG: PLP-dependent aspartate aminotransferase family protein [Synergistetes bacterium]|nr:PLP-dependent aspartate aminotransferase family protein [Synergistota bacterium]MCX8128067.1 PLP-dependent aspartate aminotransferase family protein [Synergistota bacterium]MDW8193161.1 PLP-dependent aspartate aminotransferase family protein [Synergistota bacterium]